jgi:preprotein translocase subunit SecF
MKADGKSLRYRLYHGETSIDFIGRTRRWFLLSGAVILVGLLSLVFQGLNFGIEFRGGTAWDVTPPSGVKISVSGARDAMRAEGLADARIQSIGRNGLNVQADIKGKGQTHSDKVAAVSQRLAKLAHVNPNNATLLQKTVSVNEVGPSWGNEITRKAERALVFFMIAITIYISFRFEWKMALAAMAAMVHDILVTVGVYSVSRFPVTPATVIAFLTILGYSLYDTIVVFDKVEENTRGLAASGRLTYADTVNLSMNQVLMRSLNTSLVAILPIMSILVVGAWILGATPLEDFGLALFIGLLTGAYSSIFVASPILALLKEREPRYATIRARLVSRGAGSTLLTPAAAAASGALDGGPGLRPSARGDDSPLADSGLSVSGSASAGKPKTSTNKRPANRPPPRGRKKGKRR